jgi:hypothetical protein
MNPMTYLSQAIMSVFFSASMLYDNHLLTSVVYILAGSNQFVRQHLLRMDRISVVLLPHLNSDNLG